MSDIAYLEVGMEGSMLSENRQYRDAANKLIQAVKMAPEPLAFMRYAFFHNYVMILREMHFVATEKEIKTLKRKFLQNEKEPSCFRVSASFCLGIVLCSKEDREDGADCYRQGLAVAAAVEQEERCKTVESGDGTLEIGYVVDSLRQSIENNLAVLEGTERPYPREPMQLRNDGTPMPNIDRAVAISTSADSVRILREQPDLLDRVTNVGGNECDWCHKTLQQLKKARFDSCARCRLTYYCSLECQTVAWKAGHKKACRKPSEFQSGDICMLHGLQNKPELNGQLVELKNPDASKDRRWRVQVFGQSGQFSVSIDKLKHIRPSA